MIIGSNIHKCFNIQKYIVFIIRAQKTLHIVFACFLSGEEVGFWRAASGLCPKQERQEFHWTDRECRWFWWVSTTGRICITWRISLPYETFGQIYFHYWYTWVQCTEDGVAKKFGLILNLYSSLIDCID